MCRGILVGHRRRALRLPKLPIIRSLSRIGHWCRTSSHHTTMDRLIVEGPWWVIVTLEWGLTVPLGLVWCLF